jgi:hypothetical protein
MSSAAVADHRPRRSAYNGHPVRRTATEAPLRPQQPPIADDMSILCELGFLGYLTRDVTMISP